MENLKIGLLLMFLLLAGTWLSASGNVILENDQPLTAKTAQADTVRMTWNVGSPSLFKFFHFYGEEGATYKVDWGDGETDTYTGKGAETLVSIQVYCKHNYNTTGTYTVLLYGVIEDKK
ncbi:MAG: hypothetical protein NC114_09615 [Ruminococcus flavefaciens]|nr:hypothetical protein [Ruminococcus flavefaciens]